MPLLNFDNMATLASDTPPMSPPFHRRRKSWARKVERVCCQTLSYFPLFFVYGLTTWSVWVAVNVSFYSGNNWLAYLKASASILLYALADVSYTIAVFTDPGSPLDPRTDAAGSRKGGGYEGLPTYEDDEEAQIPQDMSTVTAKQSGKPRYCKKCRSVKPDRSHHCSTCGKCVLKMDHHCPWLATCAGLRNYKPFLLFLIYTSIFCWMCFGVSAWWVWMEIAEQAQMEEGMRVVNTVLLAVLGGVVGIVLSGFTAWHIYLSATGQTTIESLEKTRYLSPLRKNMEHQLQSTSNRNYVGDDTNVNNDSHEQTLTEHLKEIHANALPGVLRPEEGEEPSTSPSPQPPFTSSASPAHSHMRQSYASLEAQREHDRYAAYLDEQDSEKLPNAFDLGWKRNLLHVFGEQPLYWFLPVCNSTGDGWMWEVSPKWTNARVEIANQRVQWQAQQQQTQQYVQTSQQAPSFEPPAARDWRWTPGGFVDRPKPTPPRVSGNSPSRDGMGREMQPIGRRKASGDVNEYDTSSDEDRPRRPLSGAASTGNWNDIPEDFLAPKGATGERVRSASRGRRKGD
jgi:hypothetical protein